MDKGIINHRLGSVTVTTKKGEGDSAVLADVVLVPGKNRVSAEQLELLKKNAVFMSLSSKTKVDGKVVPALLQEVDIEAGEADVNDTLPQGNGEMVERSNPSQDPAANEASKKFRDDAEKLIASGGKKG